MSDELIEPHDDEPMQRPSHPAVDQRIGQRVPVLDQGFVGLVDYMGDDIAVVQAARISYGKGTKSTGTDTALVRYLMRHRHTSPFEMVEFKFIMRLPIFVARQIIRHRTASVNEYSARYSILPDRYFSPGPDSIRAQSVRNKQGRDAPLPDSIVEEFRARVEANTQAAMKNYQWAIDNNIARELARILLPLNMYTEWYWKIDLHNFLHFLSLRLDPHAQLETRQYAQALLDLARPIAPICFEAYDELVRGSANFSKPELRALSHLLGGASFEAACKNAGLPLYNQAGHPLRSGEGVEFREKLDAVRTLLP